MCILRCFGEDLDPDAFLETSDLIPYSISRKGEPRLESEPEGKLMEYSLVQFDVSQAEWEDFPAQEKDAVQFLRTHYSELRRLARFPGIELRVLDFPYYHIIDHETVFRQTDLLSAALVKLAGELGIAIELSLYPNGEWEE